MSNESKIKYLISLDLYSDMELEENPTFVCEDLDELNYMMKFFFSNGYDVLIKQQREV